MFGIFAVIWGLAAIGVLLGQAIYRLALISLVGLSMPLYWYHWATLAGWALFMAYGEGYRGFQKNFSPRVAARAAYLLPTCYGGAGAAGAPILYGLLPH